MQTSFLEINLESGMEIILESFHVSLPYTGLLEGKIVPEVNKLVFSSYKIDLDRFLPHLPFVVLNEAGLQNRITSVLPEVLFIGEFSINQINPITKDRPTFFAVIWFQDELNPIMSQENLNHLKKIDVEQILRMPRKKAPQVDKPWFKRLLG
jgi:hypothetical protein